MRRIVVAVGAVLALAGGWLAVEYFEVQKLWDDERVSEAAPTFPPAPGRGIVTGSSTIQRPEPEVAATGEFRDRSHPTTGRAVVLTDGGERRVLRFEGFETDNGPDLNVYLSAAPPGAPAGAFDDDFVDLGDLKGNVGDQNYEVPAGVDLARYGTVVIWCVRFSVAFGAAGLTQA